MKRLALVVLLLFAMSSDGITDDWIETTGDILQIALPVSAMTIAYAKKDIDGVKQFIPGYATAMGTSHALKLADLSSGHTTSAFASAEYMRERYGYAYGVPAYALAGFTGYSRIHAEKHEWYEVGVGALIGSACAYLFTEDIKVEPYKCGFKVKLRY